MAEQSTYRDWLKQDLGSLIDTLELTDMQKRFMRSRWLDQVLWMEATANKARNRYYTLRVVTILGGVTVPALVSLNLAGGAAEMIRWSTVVISLIVGMSAAVEEFFHFGDRWRHYRRTVESLKAAGWSFFQLSGTYATNSSHADTYRTFAGDVEQILQQDVEGYITTVVHEKKESTNSTNTSEDQP